MDLNYLYHRHGVALVMAANARCERSRNVHRAMARSYADRIASVLRADGAAAA